VRKEGGGGSTCFLSSAEGKSFAVAEIPLSGEERLDLISHHSGLRREARVDKGEEKKRIRRGYYVTLHMPRHEGRSGSSEMNSPFILLLSSF